jgi:hypothetical protein
LRVARGVILVEALPRLASREVVYEAVWQHWA